MTHQSSQQICAEASAKILQSVTRPMTAHLFQICSDGLADFSHSCAEYKLLGTVSEPFYKELIATATHVTHAQHDPLTTEMEESAFNLVECLVVIMRETQLRSPMSLRPAQKAILQYFVENDEWCTGKTLVEDYFHARLPLAVMQNLPRGKTQ